MSKPSREEWDADEGFARNLRTLFGPGSDYEGMGGKPLRSVALSEDKERITFNFADDSTVSFRVEGDCCSRSWIEHLDVPPDVVGEEIIAIADARMSREDNGDYECLQVYNTRFRTAKGDIVLEYRNSSNGYYGGYLVRE